MRKLFNQTVVTLRTLLNLDNWTKIEKQTEYLYNIGLYKKIEITVQKKVNNKQHGSNTPL